MARSRKKAAPAPSRRSGGGGSASPARASRATVDVVEEEKGMGLEEGLVFFTTIVLLVAFFMLDKARGSYGEGMFFN